MAIIPASEWRSQPWKNGGGVTREILRWPDRPVDDYEIRVSLADITRSGPFSTFPGYQRFIVFVGPDPIELRMGPRIDRLVTPNATTEIDGRVEILATLPAGASRLLNLLIKDGARYAYGYGVPDQPVRFAFVTCRLEARLHDPPARITERALWIA